tara:strand:+ start:115 stop:1287 length:1173 start_codon:yes stop_codon:yes gene_type:complete
MTEITIEKLLIEINKEANKIDDLYNKIDTDLREIKKYRDQIKFKEESLDDFKFYNGIIDNIYTYYKKSKTIRLNKFSKDLKGHCIKIKLDRKLDYDIYFSVNKIKQITEKYNQKVKDNNRNLTNDKNKYYWLKDSDYNKLEEWPRKLYYLMKYHYLIAEFLYDALTIENNFLRAKKENPININSNTFNTNMFESFNTNDINILVNNSILNATDIIDSVLPKTKTQLKNELCKIQHELLKNKNALAEANIKLDENMQNKQNELDTALENQKSELENKHQNEISKLISEKKEDKNNELQLQLNNHREEITNLINKKDEEIRITLERLSIENQTALQEKETEKETALQEKETEKETEKSNFKNELETIINNYRDSEEMTKENFLQEILNRLNE